MSFNFLYMILYSDSTFYIQNLNLCCDIKRLGTEFHVTVQAILAYEIYSYGIKALIIEYFSVFYTYIPSNIYLKKL